MGKVASLSDDITVPPVFAVRQNTQSEKNQFQQQSAMSGTDAVELLNC